MHGIDQDVHGPEGNGVTVKMHELGRTGIRVGPARENGTRGHSRAGRA